MRSEPRRDRAAGVRTVHLVGNVNLDIVMGPVEAWPEAGTERIVERQEVRAGGAAGVAAMALQALGAPFELHARVGDDAFGAILQSRMGQAGRQLEVTHATTAASLGLSHPGGERTFLTHLGHLRELDLEKVARRLEASPPGLALVCGTFLMPPLRGGGAGELLRRARSAGHLALLDTGWPSEGFSPEVRAELDALLPLVDVVLPNEAEALGWTAASSLTGAIAALERGGARAVVKRGPDGASWLVDGAVRTSSAFASGVVDTVGAGDAFNAAFAAALASGGGLEQAAVAGVAYASLVVASQPRAYPSAAALADRLGGRA